MIRTDFRSLIKGWQRISYFAGNFIGYKIPDIAYRIGFKQKAKSLSDDELHELNRRVDYYAKLAPGATVDPDHSVEIGNFKYPWNAKKKHTTYFFDLLACIRCFPHNLRFSYCDEDISEEWPYPILAKARPIVNGYSSTVLLPLNKVRHFRFIDDPRSFREKKDMIVFRNVVRNQPWRSLFLQKYVNHPMCDAGQINHDTDHPEFVKPYIRMEDMLEYKFIACIEGNDVATNLKWVMSSNSVAVMPKPRIESWFMEGTLIPDYHYIEVKPDYSDLIEKLEYYIAHPEKAELIISHAHDFVDGFRNKGRELLIARLTTERYFKQTGQL